jgi:hypothetical protein
VVQAITRKPSIDNTIVTNGIKAIEMKQINENDPIEKAKKLYDLATMQMMFRDDGTTFGTSSIANLKAASELLKDVSTPAGRRLLDKINLTRLNYYSIGLYASRDDLSRYDKDIISNLSNVEKNTIRTLLWAINFSSNIKRISEISDKSVIGHRLYFEAVVLDSFGNKIQPATKKRLIDNIKTNLSAFSTSTVVILPEKPIMNDIMPDVYALYAQSVLEKIGGAKYKGYQEDYQKILTKIDKVVVDSIQNSTTKISALRVLKVAYENVGLSSKTLSDQALTLSKLSKESGIMYQSQFGKRSSNITLKNNP